MTPKVKLIILAKMKIEITLTDRRAAKAPSVVTTKEMDGLYKLLVEMAEQDTDWRLDMSTKTADAMAAATAMGDKFYALRNRVVTLEAAYAALAAVHEDPDDTAAVLEVLSKIGADMDATLRDPVPAPTPVVPEVGVAPTPPVPGAPVDPANPAA